MPAIDQTTAAMLLQGLAGNASYVATVSPPLFLRLTVNAPTAAVAGTELTGTGYTAGGKSCAFSAATTTTSGAQMVNSGSPSWTNGSASVAWMIVGWELWDNAGAGIRKLFGLWNGQPLTVGPSSTFQLAAGGLTITMP